VLLSQLENQLNIEKNKGKMKILNLGGFKFNALCLLGRCSTT
jgi:hypothetical protein